MSGSISQNACKLSSDSGTREVNLFRELSTQLSELGQSIDVNIVPFADASLPHFSKSSPEKQKSILLDLGNYLDICQTTLKRGDDLKNSSQLLWSALKKLKLRPTSDLFQNIKDNSVIEIHDHQLIQIFRSFNFYESCSYSLEELYCVPWSLLYRRNLDVQTNLINLAISVFEGKVTSTVPTSTGLHIVEEISSPLKFKINLDVVYTAPLYDDVTGRVAATASIETGELLNPRPIKVERPELALEL